MQCNLIIFFPFPEVFLDPPTMYVLSSLIKKKTKQNKTQRTKTHQSLQKSTKTNKQQINHGVHFVLMDCSWQWGLSRIMPRVWAILFHGEWALQYPKGSHPSFQCQRYRQQFHTDTVATRFSTNHTHCWIWKEMKKQ